MSYAPTSYCTVALEKKKKKKKKFGVRWELIIKIHPKQQVIASIKDRQYQNFMFSLLPFTLVSDSFRYVGMKTGQC